MTRTICDYRERGRLRSYKRRSVVKTEGADDDPRNPEQIRTTGEIPERPMPRKEVPSPTTPPEITSPTMPEI
ncbi:MAG: hypothetical protein V8S08_11260 [Lachnoclostridium sp.]